MNGTQDVIGGLAVAADGSIWRSALQAPGSPLSGSTPMAARIRISAPPALRSSLRSSRATISAAVDHSEGIALQRDGGIIVANRTSGGNFGVVRLAPGGTSIRALVTRDSRRSTLVGMTTPMPSPSRRPGRSSSSERPVSAAVKSPRRR